MGFHSVPQFCRLANTFRGSGGKQDVRRIGAWNDRPFSADRSIGDPVFTT